MPSLFHQCKVGCPKVQSFIASIDKSVFPEYVNDMSSMEAYRKGLPVTVRLPLPLHPVTLAVWEFFSTLAVYVSGRATAQTLGGPRVFA